MHPSAPFCIGWSCGTLWPDRAAAGMRSSHQGCGLGLDPGSHTVFTFSWPKPLDWTPMLLLRTALRNVRGEPHSAVTAACDQHVSRAVLPSSDWGSLPQDVLLFVVARLQGRHVVPVVAVCNQCRGLLAQFVTHSKLSQLPLSTPKMDAAQRKFLWVCAGLQSSTVRLQTSFHNNDSIFCRSVCQLQASFD